MFDSNICISYLLFLEVENMTVLFATEWTIFFLKLNLNDFINHLAR